MVRKISQHTLMWGVLLLLAACNMPTGSELDQATLEVATSTPILLPTEASASISGLLWHDLCAVPDQGQPMPLQPPDGCLPAEGGGFRGNGMRDPGEPGIAAVVVSLGEGACPSTGLRSDETGPDGFFHFEDLGSGTYCITIDPGQPKNTQILIPGEWTSAPADASGMVSLTIDLRTGDESPSLEFGWDFELLPPYEMPVTETPEPSATPETHATQTPEPTAASTATQQAADPDLPSGNPDWRDGFANDNNWPLYDDDHIEFSIENNKMVMTAFNPDWWDGWMISWPDLGDFYLEGIFKTRQCSGLDHFGLVTRSTKPDDAYIGYLFGVSCNGSYSLRSWDGEEFDKIVDWTAHPDIPSGSNQTYRLGFRAEGETIGLYVNGKRVAKVQDGSHSAGKFGLFVGSVNTSNLKVDVEEMSYWNLP